MQNLVVAFSGGKDSTAMALELHRQGHRFRMLYTPTGNELPEVDEHIRHVMDVTGAKMVVLDSPTLGQLIVEQHALPNWRMRWCTRMIKIEPCQQWLKEHPRTTLAVGLRADEPGRVGGVYGDLANTITPMRDWGWGIDRVRATCRDWQMKIPHRTDCAVCFYQTLHEWWSLWKNHPEYYAEGERWEKLVGHTFRSPSRDTRPAALRDLRAEFEKGWVPAQRERKQMCRVCSL